MKSRQSLPASSTLALSLIAAAAIVVSIVGAALSASLNLQPTRAWSLVSASSTAATTPELVDARRAAGEAAGQASLLNASASRLSDGAVQLEEGQKQLSEGVDRAAEGSDELSAGLVELQAAVGQMGSGANEIANGVNTATEPFVAFGAVRGQILGSVDRTIAELEGNDDPAIVKAREDLKALRAQAETLPIDESALGELERLRSGSRELANQLGTPGFAFHDGIYSATEGSKKLASGLKEIQAGTDEAESGTTSLREGAERVDSMASTTTDKIGAVTRALPPTGDPADEGPMSALSPVVALLVAALAGALGGAAGLAVAVFRPEGAWRLVGTGVLSATVSGLVGLFVFAIGLTVNAVMLGAAVLALGAVAAAGSAYLLVTWCGAWWGTVVAGVLALVQFGFVGWLWRSASFSEVAGWANSLAGAMPLHWSTSALTTAGNGGDSVMFGVALGITVASAVVGLLAMAFLKARVR